MKLSYSHILCIVMFLMSAFAAQAQEVDSNHINDRLEQYESLCRTCLSMKQRVASGEIVSRVEAKGMIDDFVAMNKVLQNFDADMTAAQRRRLSEISSWFLTGIEPQESPAELLPLSHYLSEVSIVPLAELPSLLHVDVPAVGSVDHPGSLFLMASIAVPDFSCGLMAGYQYRRWGGYATLRSNHVSCMTSYSCMSDGSLPDGGSIWSSGQTRRSNLFITAGCLFGFNDRFSMYAGAGYGRRTLAWEDVSGSWVDVSDWSCRGLAIDAGVIFSWHRLAISAGINTISFKTAAFTCGIGVLL